MNTQQAPNNGIQQAPNKGLQHGPIYNINDYIYKEAFKLEKQ